MASCCSAHGRSSFTVIWIDTWPITQLISWMLISVQRATSKPILLRRTGGPTPPVHFSSVGLLFFLGQIPPTSMLLHSQRSIFLSMIVSESRVPSFLTSLPHSLNHWQFLDCQACWELQSSSTSRRSSLTRDMLRAEKKKKKKKKKQRCRGSRSGCVDTTWMIPSTLLSAVCWSWRNLACSLSDPKVFLKYG